MKVFNSNMTMFKHHPTGGSSAVNLDRTGLEDSNFFLKKSDLQLSMYFHYKPQDLERALNMPEVVERLKGDPETTIFIAGDNMVCCKALINSGKFPELTEKLRAVKENLENRVWWSIPKPPGGK